MSPRRPTIYVLDTNVLAHDPHSLFKFQEHHIVLPMKVIEELDGLKNKSEMNGVAYNVREVSRILDDLRTGQSLSKGIILPGGGTLRVLTHNEDMLRGIPSELNPTKGDNIIIATALSARQKMALLDTKFAKCPVVLVSKDTNQRLKVDALDMGITAEDYLNDKVDITQLHTGYVTIDVDLKLVDTLNGSGEIAVKKIKAELNPNEFVLLRDKKNPSTTRIGRYEEATGKIVKLRALPKDGVWGLIPRNEEQAMALSLLLNDDINLVTLVGQAGTGKTLLALAAGLQKTSDDQLYTKLLVSRPIFPMGRDIGYLPGDVEEKLTPWMQPIFDNAELLLNGCEFVSGSKRLRRGQGNSSGNRVYQELAAMGIMQIEPLTYIRGRSIPGQVMIIDEAQNLTPHEIKTIITRAGEGTKIILTGDPHQIDNPYVDAGSNGLVYVAERFKSQSIAGHVTLTQCERSPLASIAADIL